MNPIAYHFNCPDWRCKIDYLMPLLKSKITYKLEKKSNSDFEIIICNSNNKPGISQECLNIMNYPHIWLGKGIKWTCNTLKIRLIIDHLRKSNSKYIMHLDSSDVTIIDDPEIILDRFLKHYNQNKLIFNAELTSFPDYYHWQEELFGPESKVALTSIGKKKLHKYNWPSSKLKNNKYCFLNAGCWIGEKDFALKFFESIEKYIGQTSEQTYVQKAFPNFIPEATIDNKCILFQGMVCCDESEINHLLDETDKIYCQINYKLKEEQMNNEILTFYLSLFWILIVIIFFGLSFFFLFFY